MTIRGPATGRAPDPAPRRAARQALVTGSAGFIGFHLCRLLLDEGWRVTGLDAMTPYYDVALKHRRHAILGESPRFRPVEGRLEAEGVLDGLLAGGLEVVVHLAAQAGVRHSIEAPESYVEANLLGTFRLLEAARAHKPRHLLLASTSSVYGASTAMPYGETARANTPMSFYAATKKATEAMAHSYAHLFGLPTTAFRFFTVYGPWGRPDMALFRFTRAILEGRPIEVYGRGEMRRDFTYVDDLVRAVRLLVDVVPPPPPARAGTGAGEDAGTGPDAEETAELEGEGLGGGLRIASRGEGGPKGPEGGPEGASGSGPNGVADGVADGRAPVPGDSLSPVAPYRIVNIGGGAPVALGDFIRAIEAATGRPAARTLLPMQPGDVPATWADPALLERLTGYRPATPLADGVAAFVAWYRDYYRV